MCFYPNSHFWSGLIYHFFILNLLIVFFNFWNFAGIFLKFDFCFLKISKLYFQSQFPILEVLFYNFFFIWGFLDDFIHHSGMVFLVPIFATRDGVAPLAINPNILGRLIRSFRHLEHLNPSIISYSIGRARMVQQLRRRNRTEEQNRTEYSWLRGCDYCWNISYQYLSISSYKFTNQNPLEANDVK